MSTAPSLSFRQCTSPVEKSQRFMLAIYSFFYLLFYLLIIFVTTGIILVLHLMGWLVSLVTAEYTVRKLQALGVTVGPNQFPQIWAAAEEICLTFGYPEQPRIIIVNTGQTNAFALRVARKRVVLLDSDLVSALGGDMAELRFVLAHEICHLALDHSWTRFFFPITPARFKYGRELTCDRAGLAAAQTLEAAKIALAKIVVGRKLAPSLNESGMIEEANHIESGFYGWLLRNRLTHPPVGRRIENMIQFASELNALLPAKFSFPLPSAQQEMTLNTSLSRV
jgi:Zn-dependent protease with chaperone function